MCHGEHCLQPACRTLAFAPTTERFEVSTITMPVTGTLEFILLFTIACFAVISWFVHWVMGAPPTINLAAPAPAPVTSTSEVAAPDNTTSDNTSDDEPSFTCFPKLPVELCDMIWDQALDEWTIFFLGRCNAQNNHGIHHPGFNPVSIALSCREAAARWRISYNVYGMSCPLCRESGCTARLNPSRTVFITFASTLGNSGSVLLNGSPFQPADLPPQYLVLQSDSHFDELIDTVGLSEESRYWGGVIGNLRWFFPGNSRGADPEVKTLMVLETKGQSHEHVAAVLAGLMSQVAAVVSFANHDSLQQGIRLRTWNMEARRQVSDDGEGTRNDVDHD